MKNTDNITLYTKFINNKNLMNNQNYVLGNSKKKKLLSNYFMEKVIRFFFKVLTVFNNFIFSGKFYFTLPIFAFTLAYVFFINDDFYGLLVILGPLLFSLSIGLFYHINILRQKNFFCEIKTFRQYFFGKGSNSDIWFFMSFFKFVLYLPLVIIFLGDWINLFTEDILLNNPFLEFILIIFVLFFQFIFVSFNVLNTLFIILFSMIYFFVVAFLLVHIFIFKGIGGYVFINLMLNNNIALESKEFKEKYVYEDFYLIFGNNYEQ